MKLPQFIENAKTPDEIAKSLFRVVMKASPKKYNFRKDGNKYLFDVGETYRGEIEVESDICNLRIYCKITGELSVSRTDTLVGFYERN